MATTLNVVTPGNLGTEFDFGVEEAGKIHIKTDSTLARDPVTGEIGLDSTANSVAEIAVNGTVNVKIAGVTGNAVRAIDEQSPVTALSAAQKITVLNGSNHESATLSELKAFLATENIVEVSGDPNLAGTVFSPSQPNDPDVSYVDPVTGQIWKWNGTAYVTYVPAVTVTETANGTVDIVSNGVTGNAIRVINEQTAVAEAVDGANDLVTIYNTSTGKHEKVAVSLLNTGITNNWYETVTALAPALTDAVTLSHNAPQNQNYGGAWLQNGILYSWGVDVRGMPNSSANQAPGTIPSPIPMLHNPYTYAGVAVGYTPIFSKFWLNRYCLYALDQNGRLWYKGWNTTNQSGIPAAATGEVFENLTIIDYFVTNNIAVVDLALGDGDYGFTDYNNSAFALTSTGAVYAWGYNGWGQLGIGSTTQTATPTAVTLPVGSVAAKMAFSGNASGQGVHSAILLDDGKLYTCGYNGQGQLGLGNTTQQTLFQLSASGVADFTITNFNSFYINTLGAVYTCGNNPDGFHGRGVTTATTSWAIASSFTGQANRVICLAHGGPRQAIILDNLARIWVAGGNNRGQLGLGSANVAQQNSFVLLTAVQAPFQGTVKEVWVSGNAAPDSFVVTTSGELWSTGSNQYGNRGIGNKGDVSLIRSTWTKAGFRKKIITMRPAAEQNTATFLALDEDSNLWTAGYVNQIPNGNGVYGSGHFASVPVEILWTRSVGTQTTTPTTGPVTVVTNADGSVTVDAGAGGSAIVEPFGQNVLTGIANPNSIAPNPFPISGDFYLQTSDGTATGALQASWVYDAGTATWVQVSGFPACVAVTTRGFRTYYPTTTAIVERWTSVQTAATVTAMGFTGVGGATIAPYAPVFNNYYLLACNATRAVTPTTNFTIPTSYVRHEVNVAPNVDNTYFINTLCDRETTIEVWVCNPATGVPEARLAGKTTAGITAGRQQSNQLSPLNANANADNSFQWLGFEIPKAYVISHITGTNTIKLAIRPGHNNGENTLWYYSGYAMAINSYGLSANPLMVFDNWVNAGSVSASDQWAYAGMHEGRAYGCIVYNTPIKVRIPIVDTSKDMILNVIGNAQSGIGESEMSYGEFTILHASGNVALGRPQPAIEAPIAKATLSYGHRGSGWVIPARALSSKSVLPANSAVSYLEIQMLDKADEGMCGTGFVSEYAS